LPVLLQHLAFPAGPAVFGALLAFNVPYVVLTALFWSWFVRQTPQPTRWLLAAVLLSRCWLWPNPISPMCWCNCRCCFRCSWSIAATGCRVGCCRGRLLQRSLVAVIASRDLALSSWLSGGGRESHLTGLLRLIAPGAIVFFLLGAVLSAL